jgi:subtilisin family serine protease
MRIKKNTSLLLVLQFSISILYAQKTAPNNWFNLDYKKDKVYGVSAEKAYTELIKDKKGKIVVVAVIDGGTDPLHEDLKDIIWVNPKEVLNGIDDDGNGYIDDINGWNFIGGKDGQNVDHDNLEVTRVYAALKSKYDQADSNKLSATEKTEYYKYVRARKVYFKGKQEGSMYFNLYGNLIKGTESMRKNIGKEKIVMADINTYKPQNENEMMAQKVMQQSFSKKISTTDTVPFSAMLSGIGDGQKHFDDQVKYNYNIDLNTREIVGDNYADAYEKYYGNKDVKGPEANHGTHVAGIIAAVRNNNIGMNGVAQHVKIMIVRVVPDGDERDKDVANAIRYAADNGATVINMSFGKAFSYNKKAVDDAVKYAASKDVLFVHAAGNDSKNSEEEDNFPTPIYENSTERVPGWIEVGASSWMTGKDLAAEFSNYSKNIVDVFAPGVDIYSTLPNSTYGSYDGTSMASPVTAGVAAMVRSYYPELTAILVREIILKSVTPIKKKVLVPGDKKKKVKLKELCSTGGIVNAYEALKLAETYKK